MSEDSLIPICGAVEGSLDEAVFVRLIKHVGGVPGDVYGKLGKSALLQRIEGYNAAAQFSPWVVIIDLDNDADCAPPFKERHLPAPSDKMCFRIAVREVEAWLLADRERIAQHLSVAKAKIPLNPDSLSKPKKKVIDLARKSRRREIREGVVPREGSGRLVGSTYTSHMIEFVERRWRPNVAHHVSDSLARCISSFRNLKAISEIGKTG